MNLALEKNTIIGSHKSLIMKGGENVTFVAGNETLGTAQTAGMGGYEFHIDSSTVPDGTTEITVMTDTETIRTLQVDTIDIETGSSSRSVSFFVALFGTVFLLI